MMAHNSSRAQITPGPRPHPIPQKYFYCRSTWITQTTYVGFKTANFAERWQVYIPAFCWYPFLVAFSTVNGMPFIKRFSFFFPNPQRPLHMYVIIHQFRGRGCHARCHMLEETYIHTCWPCYGSNLGLSILPKDTSACWLQGLGSHPQPSD